MRVPSKAFGGFLEPSWLSKTTGHLFYALRADGKKETIIQTKQCWLCDRDSEEKQLWTSTVCDPFEEKW